MLQVDAGDMLWARPMVGAHEKAQRERKAELLLEAAAALGVDALNPGDGDLAFGLDFLRQGARKHRLPYVSVNLADASGARVFPPYRVVERGQRRIGILGVMGEDQSVGGTTVLPMEASLRAALAELRGKERPDLVVLLSHLGLDRDREVAVAVPGIDLIFGAHSRSHQEEPVILGGTAIFQAGSQGKHLGQVTLDFRPGAEGWSDPRAADRVDRQRRQLESSLQRYEAQLAAAADERERQRLQRVADFNRKRLAELSDAPADDGKRHVLESTKIPMNRELVDQEAVGRLVKAALDSLGELPVGEKPAHGGHGPDDGHGHGPPQAFPGGAGGEPIAERSHGDFVGSAACKSCHGKEHADWQASPHAHAWDTLVKASRQFDLQCWSCHVTGAGRAGGPKTPREVGELRDVQCEACHGPGRRHVANPQVDLVKTPGEALCTGCHSEEQTENRFVFRDYYPRVDHK